MKFLNHFASKPASRRIHPCMAMKATWLRKMGSASRLMPVESRRDLHAAVRRLGIKTVGRGLN